MSSKDNAVANIKRLRRRLGLSQTELGDRLGGWPRQAVSAAEKGKRAFPLDELDLFAVALRSCAEDLIGPPVPCTVCGDCPPRGMQCQECGTKGELPKET